MIYIEGIKLKSDDSTEELHRFARKIVLGKSWFNIQPDPHYVLICPYKFKAAEDLIEKRNKKKDKINLEIQEEFRILAS